MRRQAKRRPMVNPVRAADPRVPGTWGPPDPLPGGRVRDDRSIIEKWRVDEAIHPMAAEAAYEIDTCYRAIVAGQFARTARYGEYTSPGPDTDWPAGLAIAIRDRYGPWRDAMSALYKLHHVPALEITIDLIVEGRSLREIDAAHRWRKETAARLIKWALTEYAIMAGWMRDERQNRGWGTKPR